MIRIENLSREKEGIMRRSGFLSLFLLSLLVLAFSGLALAESKVVTIPQGTVIEKLGPGHFKLKSPEGCVFEIKSYQKSGQGRGTFGEVGIIGDCGIYDKSGKIIATGNKGILKSGPKAVTGGPGKALKNVPATSYIKIDDEVTWLPATIEFQPLRIFNRQALMKLSPQPDPPGKR
jgi:hypothetical protein